MADGRDQGLSLGQVLVQLVLMCIRGFGAGRMGNSGGVDRL